jgi:hypothetical protein
MISTGSVSSGIHDATYRLKAKTSRKDESFEAIGKANFKISYDEEISLEENYAINPKVF